MYTGKLREPPNLPKDANPVSDNADNTGSHGTVSILRSPHNSSGRNRTDITPASSAPNPLIVRHAKRNCNLHCQLEASIRPAQITEYPDRRVAWSCDSKRYPSALLHLAASECLWPPQRSRLAFYPQRVLRRYHLLCHFRIPDHLESPGKRNFEFLGTPVLRDAIRAHFSVPHSAGMRRNCDDSPES